MCKKAVSCRSLSSSLYCGPCTLAQSAKGFAIGWAVLVGVRSPIDASEAQSCPELPLFDESIDNRHQEKPQLVTAYSEAESTLFAKNMVTPGRNRGDVLHIALWKASSSGSAVETATDQQMTPIRKTSIPLRVGCGLLRPPQFQMRER